MSALLTQRPDSSRAPKALPEWSHLLGALALLAVIGMTDYGTGWELSLFVFYAVPIVWAVWKCGELPGLMLAGISAIIWWTVNYSVHPYQTNWGYIWAGICRLIYFLSVYFGAKMLQSKQAVDRARIKALEHAARLEREILWVAEHEQQRIGQDLHDGLCQHLAAIGCAAHSLADDLRSKAPAEAAVANDIEHLLKDAVTQARDLARGIFPVQMNEAGLAASLQELATSTSRLTSVSVSYEESGEVRLPNPEMAMHLYRIAQEALSNALRHACGKKVLITLLQNKDTLTLRIEDDGGGLRSGQTDSKGMGLKTMQYRARSIGGSFHTGKSQLGGLSVSCVVPFVPAPSATPHHD